jgi:hypothetical protein
LIVQARCVAAPFVDVVNTFVAPSVKNSLGKGKYVIINGAVGAHGDEEIHSMISRDTQSIVK